jgi:MarR family 2-MHQ and catechol resistance regulon transcriptional repressor
MDRREGYYLERVRQYGPNYSGFDFATLESMLNIAFTYDLLHQCTARYMAEYGLSKSTFNVLMLLRHGPPEGMQLHDLGELLLVSRANITGLISHLEEKGYVTRIVDEHDRRARFAKVTPKAELLLDKFIPVHYSNMSGLMNNLSGVEKHQLVNLLTKVRESIKEHAEICERSLDAQRPPDASTNDAIDSQLSAASAGPSRTTPQK